jgi:hypothetical protein
MEFEESKFAIWFGCQARPRLTPCTMQSDFCAFDDLLSACNVPSRPSMDIDNVELSSRSSSTITSSSDVLAFSAGRSKHSDACSRKERLTLAEKLRIIGLYSTGTSQVNRRDSPLGRNPCLIYCSCPPDPTLCHFTILVCVGIQ